MRNKIELRNITGASNTWQKKFTPVALLSFLVPLNSAYANGMGGLPPIVFHNTSPTVTHSLPVIHQLNNHSTNANVTNGSQPGNQNSSGQHSGNSTGSSTSSTSSNSSNSSNSGHSGSGHAKTNVVLNHGTSTAATNIQTASNNTAITTHASALPSGYQLDLSSTSANIVLGSAVFGKSSSVTINVGGSNQTFTPGQRVTGGEYVAIQQQLANNSQNIVLNAQGAADGGKFSLNSTVNANVNEVVVPKGVTALDFFSKNSSLAVAGDLLNYGSIYGISTSNHTTSGTISAYDITNENGGVISTVLPSSLAASIPNAASSVNLALSAQNNIVNAGTISSSGTVSLNTTHGAISNNDGASVLAATNVNLSIGSGNLTNAGHITANSGNINISAPDSTDLNINASGGTFSANAGNINVRTPAYTGSSNINLNGGNYLSQNVNLNSGNGAITGTVGQVSGNLNSQAGVEHVFANTSNLNLGNNTVNGDPTFASTGNITISGANTFGEAVAILAEGNITAGNTSAAIIDSGQSVTLIAGATVTAPGATINSGTTDIPTTAQNISGATGTGNGSGSFSASVDFSTPTGGNIDLSTSTASTVIDTRSSSSSGGAVTLVAMANGATGGQVNLGTASTINAAYNGSIMTPHPDGNVTVIAPKGITIGSISNGSGTGGDNVTLVTAQPKSSGGVVQFNQSGAQTSSNSIEPDYLNIGTGAVVVGTTGSNPSSVSGSVSITSGSTAALESIFSLGSLSVSAPSAISLAGSIASNGGITLVSGSNITTTTSSLQIASHNGISTAGNIVIVAGAAYTDNGVTTTISGPSTSGGSIDFSTNPLSSLSAVTQQSNTPGGNITLVAFAKPSAPTTNGAVSVGNATMGTIATGGSGSGANGSVLVVAGQTSGQVITLNTVTTTGGAATAGNVEIDAATPNTTPNVVIQQSNSLITSGNFSGGAVNNATAAVSTVNINNSNLTLMGTNPNTSITTLNGTVSGLSLTSTQDIQIVNPITASSIYLSTTGGIATITNSSHMPPQDGTLTGGQVTLLADGAISIGANIFAPGGLIIVSGQSVQDGFGIPPTISTASSSGNAGNMTIVAGAAFTATGSSVTITGPSGHGGDVDNAGGPLISTASSNGNGGNLNLISFNGNIQTGNVSTATSVQTGGSGAHSNGNILAIAQTSASFSDSDEINLPAGLIATTGGTGGGGNITAYTSQPNATGGITIQRSTSDLPVGAQALLITGAPGTGDIAFGPTNMPSGSTMTLSSGSAIGLYTVNLSGGTFNAVAGTNGLGGAGIVIGSQNTSTPNPLTANTIVATAIAGGPAGGGVFSSITSTGSINAPGGIVLVATGSITLAGRVSTAAPTNSGNLTVIAGATFTESGNTITITGQNQTGAGISFTSNPSVTTASTNDTNTTFSGGNFNAIAFGGGVNLLGTPVTTGGSGSGANGNLLVIAGGSGGGSGALFGSTGGTVNTSGGPNTTGGNITIQTATPNATVAAPILVSTITSDLSNTSANPLNAFGSANFLNTSIVMNTSGIFTVNKGSITLMSGGEIDLQSITGSNTTVLSASANLALGSGNNLNFFQPVNVHQIIGTVQESASNSNNLTISGALTAPGGILLVSGGSISNNSTLSTANAGVAGNMTLVSGAAFTESATSVTVTGESVSSPINMQGVTLTTKSTGVNTAGGDMNLIAFGGQINAQIGPTFVTGGTGTGINGNFTAVAGGDSGSQLLITSIDTTGGAAGTGNITLLTAMPNTTPNVVLSKTTSDISTGSFLGGAPTNSNVNLSASGPTASLTANGAVISVTSGAGIPDQFTVTDASTTGPGGSVTLSAVGNINLAQSSISVNGGSTNAKGGNIALTFGTLGYLNSGSGPLILNANANTVGTGNGGNISVTTPATTAAAIGTSAGNFEFNAASGASGGNGGIASFITGGNLTVNTAGLVLTPHGNGNGQIITLTAGNGAGPGLLAINGPLSANGVGSGLGGTIALQSNSTTNFLINSSASTNGINGALSTSAATAANDGTISVINKAGAIVQLLPINTAFSITLTGSNAGSSGGSGVIVGAQLVSPTGNVNVTATTGNVTYNTVAQAIFAGNSISLAAGPTGGTIGTAATPLSLDAPTVNITGSSSLGVVNLLNFADGGQLLNTGPFLTNGNFTYIGSGTITINPITHNGFGSITGNVTITSALLDAGDVYGNIVLGGNLSSGAGSGVVSLTTNGAFGFSSLQPTASAQAVTVNLQTGTGSIGAFGTPFQVNATNLSVMGTGLVDINNSGTTPVTLTSANTTSGFILTSQGQININTGGLSNAGAIVLQAQANNGGVAINNVNLGGAATTGGITLGANGTGLLSETGSGTVIGNGPMSLTAQTGGVFLNINTTGNLTATGTGVVSLGNLNFGSDTVVSGAGGTKWTYGSNGSLVLNNITVSNGFIIALAGGNLLQVNPGSAISATNGQIILENANTASGSIVIGANSFIHTGGTGGPVNIVIGAVPVSPVPGTKPSNFHIGINTGGSASFGTNSVANPSSLVTLNLAGDNIVFNTGTRPASAISVGGGSTITADPVGFVGSASSGTPSMSMLDAGLGANLDSGRQTASFAASLPTAAISSNNANSSGFANVAIFSPIGAGNINLSITAADAVNASNSTSITNAAAISNTSGLSSNSGLTSAINGSSVLNAILGSVSNISSNAANNVINSTAAQASSSGAAEAQWISETEIVNGAIPATLSSDDELGIKQGQGVSTVIEMDEQGQGSGQPLAQAVRTMMQSGMPLQGAVSRTASGARVVNLKIGSVVFAPSRDTIVNTSFGTVKIGAKSVVLIIATRQGVAIFDLDDSHSKAVSIAAGSRELTLAPGLHALITNDSVKEYADVNPAQMIGHRNLRAQALGAGRQAFVSEFSVPQAVSTVTPLKQLMNTKHPHGQKVAEHLLKTTAILMQTHQGDYAQVLRPALTAYMN